MTPERGLPPSTPPMEAPATGPGTSLEGSQVVFLSSVDWDSAWQRHHAFASAFARRGHPVFFVENTGFRDLEPSDARRVARRLARAFLPGRALSPVHPLPEGMRAFSPLVLPPTRWLYRLLNRLVLLPALAWWMRRCGLRDRPVAFAYIPSQTTLDLLELLKPRLTVYDVVDHFRGHPVPPRDLDRTEAELLGRADLVLATSPLLEELHAGRHPRVRRVHHGVSEEFFLEPPALPRRHRRLCYFGTLREGIDYGAVNALAEAGYEVELIGPEQAPPPLLHPRVRRRGLMTTRDLVRELAGFDAMLLPYESTEFNQGVIPAKIYECLATGRPVLASALPALRGMEGLVYLARAPGEFVAAARTLDAGETPEKARARIREARRHSGAAQFGIVLAEIGSAGRAERGAQGRPQAGAEGSPGFRPFLEGLTWIAVFFTAAKAATWLTQILAARALGPEEFGKANLVVAVNSLAQVAAMLGFPLALARFESSMTDEAERARFTSTALWSFLAWAALSFAALDRIPLGLREWAGLDPEAWTYALILAYATSAHMVASSALQGLTWFRRRGIAEALYGLCAAAAFALLVARGHHTYRALVLSLSGGLALAAGYGLWLLKGYVRPVFDPGAMRAILPFAVMGTWNVLAAACVQAPGRICLFRYESTQSAGIYSAYFTATAQIALALVSMVSTVLIPLTSRPEGQREAWRRLRRSAALLVAAAVPGFAAAGWAAISLAGRSYPMRWPWLALFAAAAALIFAHGVISAVFAARSTRGLAVSVLGAVLAGLGNLLLNVLWVPRWGITGSAAALLTGYGIGLAWYLAHRPEEAP